MQYSLLIKTHFVNYNSSKSYFQLGVVRLKHGQYFNQLQQINTKHMAICAYSCPVPSECHRETTAKIQSSLVLSISHVDTRHVSMLFALVKGRTIKLLRGGGWVIRK